MCYISSFKNSSNSFVFLKPESSSPQSLFLHDQVWLEKKSFCDFAYTFEFFFFRSDLFQLGLFGVKKVLISTVNSFEAVIFIECQTGTYNFGYRNWPIKKTKYMPMLSFPLRSVNKQFTHHMSLCHHMSLFVLTTTVRSHPSKRIFSEPQRSFEACFIQI